MRIFIKINQLFRRIPLIGVFGNIFNFLNTRGYMRYYVSYLKSLGIKIEGVPKYISPTVYFDGKDYSKFQLEIM